jgi:DNA-binding NarL/FixJ family response regulator
LSAAGRDRLPRRAQYRHPSIRVNRFTPGLPKVLILHDHSIISEALALTLAGRAEVVAETQSGQAAVALCELHVPDVVVSAETTSDGVIDYFAPALLQTGARILLLCDANELTTILGFAELGITGIIDSDASPEHLARAVLTLSAGGAVFPPDITEAIVADWRRARRTGRRGLDDTELTTRELDVLGAMSDGLSTKAVAHYLGISAKTVESHKTRIFDKLGVRTQAQAVALVAGTAADPPLVSSLTERRTRDA